MTLATSTAALPSAVKENLWLLVPIPLALASLRIGTAD